MSLARRLSPYIFLSHAIISCICWIAWWIWVRGSVCPFQIT